MKLTGVLVVPSIFWARSIQPKFQPVRPGKEDHLKRWTRFFETFPAGPNRSIEFWTEIFRKVWLCPRQFTIDVSGDSTATIQIW